MRYIRFSALYFGPMNCKLSGPSGPSGALGRMSVSPSSFIGPILIGTVLDWFLLGSLIVQLYVFSKNQATRKDRVWLRILVYTVVAANVIETALCAHFLWFYAITHWGNADLFELRTPPLTAQAIGPVTGVVALLVQCTYSWRIWTITRSYVFRALVCLAVGLSVTQFGAFLAPIVYIRVKNTGGPITPRALHVIFIVELVGNFAADTLIAAGMFVLLIHSRAQTAWTHTQTLYDRLIIITLSTGLLTATAAGVALALFMQYPNSNTWYIPALFISKLYGNSFIAALNDRFFRPEERVHDLDTDASLRMNVGPSVDSTSIRFSRGDRHDRHTVVDLQDVGSREPHVHTDRASTTESSLTVLADKDVADDGEGSILNRVSGKAAVPSSDAVQEEEVGRH